jgi:hypothetical protein
MIRHRCDKMAEALGYLESFRGLCTLGDVRSQDDLWRHVNITTLRMAADRLIDCITTEQLPMPQSLRQIHDFRDEGRDDQIIASSDYLRGRVEVLEETIHSELSSSLFLHIPADRAEYFEQERAFGDAVYEAFPSGRQDIMDASNAIAVDLPNAAVHELIRVAEIGLRVFARYCRVPSRPKPYHQKDWGNFITEISSELKRATIVGGRTVSASPKRRDAIEYCTKVVEEVVRINEGWRRESAHNRTNYTVSDAKALYDHVHTFMELLAAKINETSRRQIPKL